MRRPRVTGSWPAAVLAAAALAACNSNYSPPKFVTATPATGARIVTVTVDQCDCDLCRIALQSPPNGTGLFSAINPALRAELTAVPCYTALSIEAILECGNCLGPGACTVTATVRAAGAALAPQLSCQTLPAAGASCQDVQTLDIDPNSPTFDCSL